MAQPSYDPYYHHRHHHHHHHQQPLNYLQDLPYNEPPPTLIQNQNPIHIPIEQRHINTLFVSGLPDDVHPREIHNLFRRRPGFDSCQLKFTGRGNQVVAFVTFFNHQSAVMALQALDGAIFDPQSGSVLHIELARSNSRRKRKLGGGPYVVIDERRRGGGQDAEETSSDDGENEAENPSGKRDFNSSDAKSDEKVDPDGTLTAANELGGTSDGDLHPCSTLFIANLGPNCSEEELKQALSLYPGFNGLKLRTKGGMPVAFVDFEEVEQATDAMQALQGSLLPSSDRGGMHVEYARSKMRKP